MVLQEDHKLILESLERHQDSSAVVVGALNALEVHIIIRISVCCSSYQNFELVHSAPSPLLLQGGVQHRARHDRAKDYITIKWPGPSAVGGGHADIQWGGRGGEGRVWCSQCTSRDW